MIMEVGAVITSMNLNPLPIRRKWIIKQELKVHVFSTLIWWGLWCVLVGAGSLAMGRPPSWTLIIGALPLIAILEGLFFLGSVLRR